MISNQFNGGRCFAVSFCAVVIRCLLLNNNRVTFIDNSIILGLNKILIFFVRLVEAGCGAAAQSVTVKPTGCGFDPHSRR